MTMRLQSIAVPAMVRDASDRAAARSETGDAERMAEEQSWCCLAVELIDFVRVGLVSRLGWAH